MSTHLATWNHAQGFLWPGTGLFGRVLVLPFPFDLPLRDFPKDLLLPLPFSAGMDGMGGAAVLGIVDGSRLRAFDFALGAGSLLDLAFAEAGVAYEPVHAFFISSPSNFFRF